MENRKKQRIFRLTLGVGILVLLAGSVYGYTYYQKKQTEKQAEQVVNQFVQSLKAQKFEETTKLLTPTSLKQYNYTEKTLQQKYQAVYQGIGLKQLTIAKEPIVKRQGATFEFHYQLTFQTELGDLKQLAYQGVVQKNGQAYQIKWQPNLIFPKMTGQDKVAVEKELAKRGAILDRNKQGLAVNQSVNQLGVVPNQLGTADTREQAIAAIATQFHLTTDAIQTALKQTWVQADSFVPLTMLDEAVPTELPVGATIHQVESRYYPLGEAAAQLIGYVGAVHAEDIKKDPTLDVNSLIGRTGLEQTFDEQLRGRDGGKIVVTDQKGMPKATLLTKAKKDGTDIVLTIDANVQKIAFAELENHKGSTVVTQPTTGDLLAVTSSPSFNPNKMANGISTSEYNQYANNPNKPFISRFATRYAPGSTFKTITGAIGIDAGTLNPDENLPIAGLRWQKSKDWGSYEVTRVKESNPTNLYKGMIYSDNIYFAQQTLKMGKEAFTKGLDRFIFNEKLELPLTMKPAQYANENTIHSEILLADTGYGQGQLLINPIQQATMYSVFANEGTLVYPKLLLTEPKKVKEQVISAHAATIIGKTLRAYVTDPEAFGHSLNGLGIELAAKTGTAEVKAAQDDPNGTENSFLLTYDYAHQQYLTLTMFEGSSADFTAIQHVSNLLTYMQTTYH